MTDYRTILAEALRVEDKANRDHVLAKHPDQAAGVRHLMDGIAQQHAARIRYAGARGKGQSREPYTPDELRELRREMLAAIEPAWLRDRVETMVREQFAGSGAGR